MCEAVAPNWSVRLSVRQVGPVVLRAGVVTVHYLLAVLGPQPPTPLFGGAACTGTASTGMCVTGRRDLEQYERKIQGDHTHTLLETSHPEPYKRRCVLFGNSFTMLDWNGCKFCIDILLNVRHSIMDSFFFTRF